MKEYIVLYFVCLILLYVKCYNKYIVENIFSDIVILKKNNISNMFISSVNLYNKQILFINFLYKKIQLYNGNKKALIVLLYYNEIRTFINRNYIFLKQKYHDKLIFYVTENITLQEKYRNIEYNVIDISSTFYKFPYKFNESEYISIYRRRGKWNYQHMCRFFFRDIFLHPSLYDVDIYMRLDSESILNTTVNLFNYMKSDIVYMHNRIFNDAEFVVNGLKDYIESLVKVLNVDIRDIRHYSNTFKKTVLGYYNNFEICRMSFFRSKEIFQFVFLVDFSYGQFIYRWGDAPLRYISLSLFADNHKKISLPKYIKYCHKDCR